MSPEAMAPLTYQHTPIVTIGYIMQILFSLAVVLAIIYAISKYLLPRMKITAPGRIIKVLDRVFLEPQVSAYILKVGKSAWLVVASSKQVARIDKIDEELSQ